MANSNICPFLSGITFDPSGTVVKFPTMGVSSDCKVECIQTDCHLWDTTKSRCSFVSLNIFTTHIHDSHYHMFSHGCTTIPSSCGSPSESPPIATKLISEFMSNQDLDGNGMVYGFEFKISDDDSKPPMLYSVEGSEHWPNPTFEMTWEQYLESL